MGRERAGDGCELDVGAQELAPILTYPRFSAGEHAARVAEIRSLGIESLFAAGRTTVGGVRIAGKGCVGLVLKARASDGRTCALKIRRLDADRKTMREEARLHSLANSAAGVGPRLEAYSDNFIVMEFISGDRIADWMHAAGETEEGVGKGKGKEGGGQDGRRERRRKEVRAVAASVLEQCYSLDRAGIDHGELSRMSQHVIVSDGNGNDYDDVGYGHGLQHDGSSKIIRKSRATIIDFESASTARRTSNVTAAAQAMFVSGGPIATRVAGILGAPDREKALAALKAYKRDQTRANFQAILGCCKLDF